MNSLDERKFIKSLTETIAWCSEHASLDEPEDSLRVFGDDVPYLCHPDYAVHLVALKRHHQLWEASIQLEPVTDLCGGRLLAYFPNWNTSDGISSFHTKKFLDVHNCPPFDTWVWYVWEEIKIGNRLDNGLLNDSYLIAWIPPLFLNSMLEGMAYHIDGCIKWLDELDNPFTESLSQLGFLTKPEHRSNIDPGN